MTPIKRLSWIGLGAIGSAYLSKIAETHLMENIRVIASGDRADRLRTKGVRINGRQHRFPVRTPEEKVEPADLLIFAVKNHHLPQAIRDVKNHVGPNTIILSLLNGITSEGQIAEVYGADKLLYSYSVKIDATRTRYEVVFTTLGLIPFGEAANPPGEHSEKVQRVAEFFTRTGIDYIIPEDMVRSLWAKFMLNVGVNQVSAVLRAPYGPFQHPGEPRDLVRSAMLEVVALAPKEGVLLTPEDAVETLKAIDALSPEAKTSMAQDIAAGQKTEVEMFGGAVVAMGERHGVPVPVNSMLLRLLRCLESLQSR